MYGSHKLPNNPHRSPNPKSECDNAENNPKNNQHAKFLRHVWKYWQDIKNSIKSLGLSLTQTWGTCAPTMAVISSPKLQSATLNIAVTVLLPAITKGALFQVKNSKITKISILK
jgi:hypothetical protein